MYTSRAAANNKKLTEQTIEMNEKETQNEPNGELKLKSEEKEREKWNYVYWLLFEYVVLCSCRHAEPSECSNNVN